jgi:hypothetical protein
MVMFFQLVPMDPNIRLLTIERLELPAIGGLEKWPGNWPRGGCAKEKI